MPLETLLSTLAAATAATSVGALVPIIRALFRGRKDSAAAREYGQVTVTITDSRGEQTRVTIETNDENGLEAAILAALAETNPIIKPDASST